MGSTIRKFIRVAAAALVTAGLMLPVRADQVGPFGGGFTGGTVAGATTFSSTVQFNGIPTFATKIRVIDGSKTSGSGSIESATAGNQLYFGSNFFGYAQGGISQWFLQCPAAANCISALASTGRITWSNSTGADSSVQATGLTRVVDGVLEVEAAAGVGGWIRSKAGEVALNADYTNATTGFTSTALSVTVISGRTYNFDVNLFASDSTSADGVKINFNGGSAAATNFRAHCTLFDTALLLSTQVTALATTISQATITGAGDIECHGTFVPSGAGTFIIQAAQNAHTAGTLTLSRGSWLSVRDANPL